MPTFKITKQIDFCYGHRLLNYDGKCRFLHGHNGRVEIEISANTLDKRGMVMDFNDIKSLVKAWIDENLDHKMLLRTDDPIIPRLKETGEPFYAMESNPTAEGIAGLLYNVIKSKGVPVVRVTLWETPLSSATYQE